MYGNEIVYSENEIKWIINRLLSVNAIVHNDRAVSEEKRRSV